MAAPGKGLSAATLREALKAHAEALFEDAFGPPLRAGAAEWRAKDNDARAMQMQGDKRGLWCDHSAGDGGDLLDLVAITRCGLSAARDDFPAVLKEAHRLTGALPEPTLKPRTARTPAPAAYDAGLLAKIRAAARPVAGTPAARYLASRAITRYPPSRPGQDALAYLPPLPGLRLRGADTASLLIWATDADGICTGGQRILLAKDGRRQDAEVAKPSFGRIRARPARFGDPSPDLILAEGPESALSIWQATGCETWAVFGVSGWARAPLPPDRPVILAPDRDAPTGPAGRAFARAVCHHLEAGAALRIAEAPEPEGSKKDLNDTHMRAGDSAVRAAIAAAIPPDPAVFKARAQIASQTASQTAPDTPSPLNTPPQGEGP